MVSAVDRWLGAGQTLANVAAALATHAFYLGALGSRKTHAARLERLRIRGFSEKALSRIHGPVGLDIRARTPAEIAVAVLHNKRKEKRGAIPPEIHRYWAGEELEDRWICYPWDASDIAEHQRLAARGGATALPS